LKKPRKPNIVFVSLSGVVRARSAAARGCAFLPLLVVKEVVTPAEVFRRASVGHKQEREVVTAFSSCYHGVGEG
jgi:hypothetical protein